MQSFLMHPMSPCRASWQPTPDWLDRSVVFFNVPLADPRWPSQSSRCPAAGSGRSNRRSRRRATPWSQEARGYLLARNRGRNRVPRRWGSFSRNLYRAAHFKVPAVCNAPVWNTRTGQAIILEAQAWTRATLVRNCSCPVPSHCVRQRYGGMLGAAAFSPSRTVAEVLGFDKQQLGETATDPPITANTGDAGFAR